MQMKVISRNAIGLLIVGSLVGIASAREAASKPDLSGHWVLNKEKSEDPAKKMMDAMTSNRGGSGGGMGGRGGGMGGRGGFGGGGMRGGGTGNRGGRPGEAGGPGWTSEPPLDGETSPTADAKSAEGQQAQGEQPQARRRPRGPVPSAKLEIEQQAEQVTLKSPTHVRAILVDAQTHDQEGALTNVTARFKNGALEVKSKGERGGRVERYSVHDGRLVIEFENEGMGPRPGYKFRLVYDREAAS